MARSILLALLAAARLLPQAVSPLPLKQPYDPARPEISFSRQSSLDGLDEYEVSVCNRAASSVLVDPGYVRSVMFQAGIPWASHAGTLKAIEDANRRSPIYYALIVTEVLSWSMSTVVALDTAAKDGPIKIGDRWKALFPLGASVLTFSRYLLNREKREAGLPDNLLPVLPFSVPADACLVYAFYGVAR